MARKLKNARANLMTRGKQFLLDNTDGRYGKFNVRTLTSQCGMAAGTFYRYFQDKDDLVLQIMDEDWEQVLAAVDAGMQQELPLCEKLRGIYELVGVFERNYRYSAMGLLASTPEHLAHRQEKLERLYARIRQFLQLEIDRGNLQLNAKLDSAAYLLVQLFLATGKNPAMDFDELWNCMTFEDTSRTPREA